MSCQLCSTFLTIESASFVDDLTSTPRLRSSCADPSRLILAGSQASTRASIPYWQPLLQLFGAMYLPVIFSLLFYLNLVAWSAARINFVLIFELDVS